MSKWLDFTGDFIKSRPPESVTANALLIIWSVLKYMMYGNVLFIESKGY